MVDLAVDAGGVAFFLLGDGESGPNWFCGETIQRLEAALVRVESDQSIRGLLIASDGTEFMTGIRPGPCVDSAGGSAARLFERFTKLGRLLRRLESCGKPVAALISGSAIGDGLQLALACHRRIAADHHALRLGLPEVRAGLMPSCGGTQRLPRLLGLRRGGRLLLEGTLFTPHAAAEFGLVHEVVELGQLRDRGRVWIGEAVDAVRSWDGPEFRFNDGSIADRETARFFIAENARIRQRSRGEDTVRAAILSAVYQGLPLPLEAALRVEARHAAWLSTRAAAQRRAPDAEPGDLSIRAWPAVLCELEGETPEI